MGGESSTRNQEKGESDIQSQLCCGGYSTGSVGPTKWFWHCQDQEGFLEEVPSKFQEEERKKLLLEGGTRSMVWMGEYRRYSSKNQAE